MTCPNPTQRLTRLSSQVHVPELTASAPTKPLVVTILGSGNSAHVCAALFEENSRSASSPLAPHGVVTQILTSDPKAWSKEPEVTFPTKLSPGGKTVTQKGRLSLISSKPEEVLPQSDIVLWTGPVYATKSIFEKIKPHVSL